MGSDSRGDTLEGEVPGLDHAAAGRASGGLGALCARIVRTRGSTHIGDIFRGLYPPAPGSDRFPAPGDVITLGSGVLFHDGSHDWAPGGAVGVLPTDNRDTDWLDPVELYRCHEQTVELFFVPAEVTP